MNFSTDSQQLIWVNGNLRNLTVSNYWAWGHRSTTKSDEPVRRLAIQSVKDVMSVRMGVLAAATVMGVTLAPANAAVMTAEIIAKTAGCCDYTGEFVPGGGPLDDMIANIILVYDTKNAEPCFPLNCSPGFTGEIIKGPQVGNPTPYLSASVTIANKTIDVRSDNDAVVASFAGASVGLVSYLLEDSWTDAFGQYSNWLIVNIETTPEIPPGNLHTPFSLTPLLANVQGIFEFDYCYFDGLGGCGNRRWVTTNVLATSVRVTAAPVPIPAALPLLTSALGALGFIGWRRKRKEKLAAA